MLACHSLEHDHGNPRRARLARSDVKEGGDPADAKSWHRCAGPVRHGDRGGPYLL